jgi:hypothetical protein
VPFCKESPIRGPSISLDDFIFHPMVGKYPFDMDNIPYASFITDSFGCKISQP